MGFSPKVTVGLPVYNVEKYVLKSIQSVIDQDYGNIEIIVVYDESSDNTLKVVLECLASSRFPFSVIEKDEAQRGPGNSRNLIIDEFSGDFLYFLDGDDYIEPGAISLMVKEALISDADVVAASHRSLDEMGHGINTFEYPSACYMTGPELRNFIYVNDGYYSVYCWNKLFSAKFIKQKKLRFVNAITEDALFTFYEIQKLGSIALLPQITLNYLVRDSSLTQASIYKDMSAGTAEFILETRDSKYSWNPGVSVEEICSNIDAFMLCYILLVRDAYLSPQISTDQKDGFCNRAFSTPTIPLNRLSTIWSAKKNRLVIILVVKVLSHRQNMFLVRTYHKFKRLKRKLLSPKS